MLVAPVVEKGATTRRVYLPRGTWYDFWTGERLDGGREIIRPWTSKRCRFMCAPDRFCRWVR